MSERYPLPPFPDGWYAVGTSSELPPGALRPVRYFGRELVLFRGEDLLTRGYVNAAIVPDGQLTP